MTLITNLVKEFECLRQKWFEFWCLSLKADIMDFFTQKFHWIFSPKIMLFFKMNFKTEIIITIFKNFFCYCNLSNRYIYCFKIAIFLWFLFYFSNKYFFRDFFSQYFSPNFFSNFFFFDFFFFFNQFVSVIFFFLFEDFSTCFSREFYMYPKCSKVKMEK